MVPTAHYFMGGVVVDVDTRTAMEGLYVAGEDAGGAHGSNRLGGNGVANSTVYGGIAGDPRWGSIFAPCACDCATRMRRCLPPSWIVPCHPLSNRRPHRCNPLRKRLQDVMWDHVGVMRTEAGHETRT